jgi:hypothetical protein
LLYLQGGTLYNLPLSWVFWEGDPPLPSVRLLDGTDYSIPLWVEGHGPPENQLCVCCGKHISEVKPFDEGILLRRRSAYRKAGFSRI